MSTQKFQAQKTLAAALLACLSAGAFAAAASTVRFDQSTLSGLGVRNIGSAQMSGRVSALAAYEEKGRTTMYVGAASGGVWKSRDGGTTFEPIFDKQPVQSIGAITIDPNNKETIWVGTGETWVRNSVSYGDGIYKSTDGGQNWQNMGLKGSERINEIIVHPKDSNVVYACVTGKLWSDSNERGLYRSKDGGANWTQILKGASASTGCSGLTLDANNPDVIYAGLWDFRRYGWSFRSGGNGPEDKSNSALMRSVDGGNSWTSLTAANTPGLPNGPWGRIEMEVAPSDSNIVYAFIEGTDSALYYSKDAGKSFERRDDSQMMVWRPFYFAKMVVDPKNAERLFKMNLNMVASDDGGKSFSGASGGCHADWHDVWINPNNTQHLVAGNDGGVCVSLDGGSRWNMLMNLPISQFYHVAVDNQDPYRVYGGLQDNSSWTAESSYPGGVGNERWENLYGGDGFWVLPERDSPHIVYAEYQGGNLARIDRRTKQARDIQPKAAAGDKLRFNWNAPLHISPNDGKTLYVGAQYVYRTRDRGQSWDKISPDLTTGDKNKQQQELSGGITVDNSSAEMHTTIFAIAEPLGEPNTLWVGTDDGNLQITRDAGKSWSNVIGNIKGLAKASWVSSIRTSAKAGEAYVSFDRHAFGDMEPYAYHTADYGKSWKRIASSLQGIRGYAHIILPDPVKPGLLYLGTEMGLWISIDGGARWAEFKANEFPAVSVRDIAVQEREHDLVIGTHGRGIWIIDDLSALRGLDDKALTAEFSLLPSRANQQRISGVGGWSNGDATFIGESASNGITLSYYQKTRHIFGKMRIEVLDAAGAVVDTIPAGKRAGINRITWAGRVKPPTVPKAAQAAFSGSQGPRVLPGTYTLRVTKNGQTYQQPFEIALDRRADYTLEDRKAQFEAAMRVHALFGDMSKITGGIEQMQMMGGMASKALGADSADGKALAQFLSDAQEIRKVIVATKEGGAITGEERLREQTDQLYSAIMSFEGRPGQYQLDRIDAIGSELKVVQAQFGELMQKNGPLLQSIRSKLGAGGALDAPAASRAIAWANDALGRPYPMKAVPVEVAVD